ncbi:MAG: serine/threonine protein phosphatase [Proteobacteria bacterium]|nr:serine/threonine protein phosphatase [Pseudomonadota bacterium]
MFAKLFGSAPAEARPAFVPAGSRVYAIGDIHGRADLLAELQDMIRADAAAQRARRLVVVYLGDYVDRGVEAGQVIDRLLASSLVGFETVHLLGNHERLMLDFLENAAVGPSWMMNGGVETLFSYGVGLDRSLKEERERLAKARAELERRLPARHLAFLHTLKMTHIEGDYLFVHAGIRPGVPLNQQSEADMLWIRKDFLNSRVDHGRMVVHGHSITEAPDERPNRIGIDTGAFATGRLTCLVLQDDKRSYLRTGA